MKKTAFTIIITCLVFLISVLVVFCTEDTDTGPQQPGASESSQSQTAAGTSGNAIPLAPVNPGASTLSPNVVEIKWLDNSNNEDGFKIYRGTTLVGTVPANQNVFQDTGLQPIVTTNML